MNLTRILSACLLLSAIVCGAAHAGDTIVYDDATRNGFNQACTFGGVTGDFDFANPAPVHGGSASIRFTPESYNAVSWCTPATLSTTNLRGLSLWVNGGTTGGQDLQLVFGLAGSPVASVSLVNLYGHPLPANAWVQVNASFDAGGSQFSGGFDQLWIQSNSQAAQASVYLDDVSLLGRSADSIFADGFEAIPQFRGSNLAGMQMSYTDFNAVTGPVAGTNYPAFDTRLIDYYAGKRINTLRFLFSWEGMQSSLNGPIPAAASGNYKAYFDNYKRIVDYASNVAHMQVIVEPWQANSSGGAGGAMWRGNLVGSGTVPTAAFADFWSKMATVFKANPRVSYGLVNEPNNMSTMAWWNSAQAAITAIRSAGSSQRIYVPGNGYTSAGSWTSSWYDTAATKHSNAYGWLNANGVGQPISDPLGNIVAEVHCYLDSDGGGSTTGIVATNIARQRIAVALDEAAAHGYQIYLGEMGFYAGNALAAAAWTDFIAYFDANPQTFIGYSWWAGGTPGWWDDVAANGGGHFSITPTNGATFSGDSVNMDMIEAAFGSNP